MFREDSFEIRGKITVFLEWPYIILRKVITVKGLQFISSYDTHTLLFQPQRMICSCEPFSTVFYFPCYQRNRNIFANKTWILSIYLHFIIITCFDDFSVVESNNKPFFYAYIWAYLKTNNLIMVRSFLMKFRLLLLLSPRSNRSLRHEL